jgi:hypothetical protein
MMVSWSKAKGACLPTVMLTNHVDPAGEGEDQACCLVNNPV